MSNLPTEGPTPYGDFLTGIIEETTTVPASNEPDPLKFMSTTSNILILVSTLTLGAVAVSLNLGVVCFYRKQLRSVVPFIYFILGGSDLLTGLCTVLHSLLFLACLAVAEDSLLIFWIAAPTYYITIISFRMSAFVNLVFSVIRTINILSPFSRINRKAACFATAVHFALLLTLCLAEIVLNIEVTSTREHYVLFDAKNFMESNFFRPGSLMPLFRDIRSFITKDEQPLQNKHLCVIAWVSTLPFIILPATLTMMNTVLQIYTLIKPKDIVCETEIKDNTKKKVSITIAIISSLFFFCSLFTLALPITSCYRKIMNADTQHKNLILYLCGYMSMFLNAALNSLILTLRGEKLNEYIRNKLGIRRGESEGTVRAYEMRGRDNVGEQGPKGVSARNSRYSIDTLATNLSDNIA